MAKFKDTFIKFKETLLAVVITVGVFALTKNPLTGPFALQMTLISLLALLFYAYFIKKKGRVVEIKSFVFLVMTFILFLVGSTGWFFSPFFFTLYLLAILFAFIFSPATASGFIASLVGLFSVNIGEVDLAYDFLIVLSLVATIPLVFYLRKEYLKLKESAKEILILEKEKKEYASKVKEILANKINQFATNIRQPINDARLLAQRLGKLKEKEKVEKNRQRIIASSEEALRVLKEFEEETTGEKLLTTPETA